MQTLTITAADLDQDGFYIGKTDVTDFDGHIEIAADLGLVRFRAALRTAGRIRSLSGSGIEAGSGIKAGLSISAKFVFARLRIFAGLCLWRIPSPEEMQIRAEVRSGTVSHGVLVAPLAGVAE